VDNLVNGLSWKAAVDATTTTTQTLATDFAAGQVIDGVTLVTGMRVLAKNQTDATENGLYLVPASGAPTRTADGVTGELTTNATVRINRGTQADQAWTLTTVGTITVGTTAQVWVRSDSGTPYTAGSGLDLTGNAFSVKTSVGGGILADGTSTRLDPTVAVLKHAQDVGNGSSTSITVTHGLGTLDVITSLYNKSTGEVVDTDVTNATTTTVTLAFATAPATAAYRVIIHG
jgi:hypothetical protein